MGKGKVKGWRPPSTPEAAGMLLGSADHLTGDSIASPVQLREEGRALPANHPNFGDEWGKGGKKGKGKGSHEASASGANAIPVVARPKEGWAPTLDVEDRAKMPPPVMKASSKAPPAVKQEPDPAVKQEPDPEPEVAKQVKPTRAPTAATARSISQTNPVKVDVKTEIERRREAMLQREKDAAMQRAATTKGEVDDPEARRRASELKRQEAEAASRAAEARWRRDGDAEAGNAADEPAAKRPKEETVDGEDNSGVGAIKQGLQGWAEQVNALAGGDTDLARRCREFVRKRILKAHAGGHLHTHNWATEPVPTVEELRCEG